MCGFWAWGIAVDGNDNVWVANALGRSVVHLCGAEPKNTTAPFPPKRVASVGSGTFLKPSSGRSQLLASHTLPAGLFYG
jgi:hypothetical protein